MDLRRMHVLLLGCLGLITASLAAGDAQAATMASSDSLPTTCAIEDGGQVRCWGLNQGFLGVANDSAMQTYPADVVGLTDTQQAIAVGFRFGCALATSGNEISCWGGGSHGQLGDGAGAYVSGPVSVADIVTPTIEITAGSSHACALSQSGIVQCWGANVVGQLGSPDLVDHFVPVVVDGLGPNVRQIAAGDVHTCALNADGGVLCWGANDDGQLGGSGDDMSASPVAVTGIDSGVAAISAAGNHTCALMEDGSVKCWGYPEMNVPSSVPGLGDGVAQIAVGGTHACARFDDSRIKCWGYASSGQLGDGYAGYSYMQPVHVQSLPGTLIEIAAGANVSCARTTAARMYCWGSNSVNQLGIDKHAESLIPQIVRNLPLSVTSAGPGGTSTCATLSDGTARCWGDNAYGQVGSGSTLFALEPQAVVPLEGSYVAITSGSVHACALSTTGRAECWGRDYASGSQTQQDSPIVVGDASTPLMDYIVAGNSHTCGRTMTGQAICWGANSRGQLGDGLTQWNEQPVEVQGLSDVLVLGASGQHSCAVVDGGSVECWGDNTSGQLGNDLVVDFSTVPVPVIGLPESVQSIALSSGGTCALTASGGQVWCWGANYLGQRGDADSEPTNTPLRVAGLPEDIVELTAGLFHVCARSVAGPVYCWGSNSVGELGDGTAVSRYTPAPVWGLDESVMAINAGRDHTCALMADASLNCWGADNRAQLGDGESGIYPVPQRVLIDTLFRGQFEFERTRFD